MKIDDNEFLEGIKHIISVLLKIILKKLNQKSNTESKAMNLLTLDGVFITLIITISFSSMPSIY